ncbi:hypothetical protein LSAT2_009601 [Lamellibrachia satsuma]|nr:hypothetical protein LSAT2_009601 [Lamellibrachia satsuma]
MMFAGRAGVWCGEHRCAGLHWLCCVCHGGELLPHQSPHHTQITALSVALLQLGSFLDNAVCLVSPALVSGAICGFYHWAIANVSRTHKKSAGSTEMSRSTTPIPMETKEKTT